MNFPQTYPQALYDFTVVIHSLIATIIMYYVNTSITNNYIAAIKFLIFSISDFSVELFFMSFAIFLSA